MRQPPQLRATSAALVCHFLIASGQATAASGVSNLSDGQIAGVVIGSVGAALLLGLLTVLVCCLRASRQRQTGDLTWAKSGDVEATAIDRTPHQPLAGPCAEELAAQNARRRAGGLDGEASFPGNGCRTDTSTVTGEGQSAAAYEGGGIDGTAFPNFPPSPPSPVAGGGRRIGFFRGRSLAASVGSSVGQLFVVHKGLLRNNSDGVKDKHLQVSRSARVEPSAEVEMAEPFQPAATNMGPPLSKSSMLMRWLNGADEGLPEAAVAAAQLAAVSDGASGRSGGKGATARGGSGRSGAAGAAGVGTSLDRLPLLSLAAQQTGIVWNKMPPSVASSPAVSIVESSSMFMLKGTMKRSDELEDTASSAAHGHSHTLTHAAAALATWNGGDDRYPASLAHASLDSFSNGGAQRRGGATAAGGGRAGGGGTGIVFNYVMRSSPGLPSSRTTATADGAFSRAPTIGGGAVLPVSSSGGGAVPTARHLGFEADDAFTMGVIPDEQMLAQAQTSNRASPSPVPESATGAAAPRAPSAGPWLHQVPPMKLTSLQEAGDGEEGEGEEVAPAPLPPAQPTYKQLLPMTPLPPSPSPGAAAAGSPLPPAQRQEVRVTHGSAQIARPGWTQFGDGAGSSATAARAAWDSQSALASDPLVSSRLTPEPPLPLAVAARPFGSPAAAIMATVAGVGIVQTAPAFQMLSPSGGSAYGCASASGLAPGIPHSGGAADGNGGIAFLSPGRGPPDSTVSAAAAPGGASWASPRTSASHLQRRVGAPSPLALHTPSNTSLRSQTSLASPSLGMHYPGMTDALGSQRQGSGADGCISEAMTPREGGAAAAAEVPVPLSGNSSGPPSRDAAGRELPLPVSAAASDPL